MNRLSFLWNLKKMELSCSEWMVKRSKIKMITLKGYNQNFFLKKWMEIWNQEIMQEFNRLTVKIKEKRIKRQERRKR